MKLSLMIPTFQNAETIERTSEASRAEAPAARGRRLRRGEHGSTRAIIERVFVRCRPWIESRLLTSEENTGAPRAWRVALHWSTGDWCSFVWADDVLKPGFAREMAAGIGRAGRQPEARHLQRRGRGRRRSRSRTTPRDEGVASPTEYSEGIFLRRFPMSQICAGYETTAARRCSTATPDRESAWLRLRRHPVW